MAQAKNKIILSLLSIFSLVSCNSENNKIIIDDLTVGTAKNYAKLYLNEVVKTDDMKGKYLSILSYYGKVSNKYHVMTFEYGSINPVNGSFIEETKQETIEGITFEWYHHYDQARGRVFIDNNIYTLTKAYEDKLISLDDLKEYYKIYGNFRQNEVYPSYLYQFVGKID